MVGTDALTIDTNTKAIIHRAANGKSAIGDFSKDGSQSIFCSGSIQNKECSINSKPVQIDPHIKEAHWLDNDTLVLEIGKSVFVYEISTKSLEKLGESKGQIFTHNNQILYIQQ